MNNTMEPNEFIREKGLFILQTFIELTECRRTAKKCAIYHVEAIMEMQSKIWDGKVNYTWVLVKQFLEQFEPNV